LTGLLIANHLARNAAGGAARGRWIMLIRTGALLASALSTAAACSQSPPPVTTAAALITSEGPLIAGAHFHHLHINSADPDASIAYYLKHFNAKPAKFAGTADAVWVQKSWLLFNKVPVKAPIKINSAIWHIGWGAPDAKQEFKRQTELGNTFFQTLTDISTASSNWDPDTFYFMYVASPDRTLIELNTAPTDTFGHLHLLSDDTAAAADFYVKFFGATPKESSTARRSPPPASGAPPRRPASFMIDNVNLIIMPTSYAKGEFPADWVGVSEIQPSRGTVNDHIGFSVPNLDQALKIMRANGVKVTDEPADVPGKYRHAFIEGPDRITIELIEDHTDQPPAEM
jgi:catechol 2,3-dioxygenase-like lactoylglutathione lyase family enzyme